MRIIQCSVPYNGRDRVLYNLPKLSAFKLTTNCDKKQHLQQMPASLLLACCHTAHFVSSRSMQVLVQADMFPDPCDTRYALFKKMCLTK